MKHFIACLCICLTLAACAVPNDHDARSVPVPASLQRAQQPIVPSDRVVTRSIYFVRRDNGLLEARPVKVAAPGDIPQLIEALIASNEAGGGYRTAVPRSTRLSAATPIAPARADDPPTVQIDLAIPSLNDISRNEQRTLYQQIVFTIVDNTAYTGGVVFVVNNRFPDLPPLRNPIRPGEAVTKLDYEPNTIFTTTTSTTTAPPTSAPASTSSGPSTSGAPVTSAPAPSSAPPPASATTR